jgi:PAS domain S-box-containing protein
MPKPNPPLWWSRPSPALRYMVTALALAVAFGGTAFLAIFDHTELFVSLFICAIMFVAWFGGFRPALLATSLAFMAFYYYLLNPSHSFALKSDLFALNIQQLPRLLLFLTIAVFVNLISMSQRKAAESLRHSRDALRRSEAFLAEGQRISHTGSWSWNISSGKLVWSEEHCRIFGVDPSEAALTFQVFESRVHPEDHALVQQTLNRAMTENGSFSLDYRIILPDGSLKYVHAEGRPVLAEMGDATDFIGTTMDITERKRSEELLRNIQSDLARATRLTTIGELTASIAHEINQPLGAMVASGNACLRWLTKETPQLEEARQAAERIIRDGHRAADIIKSVRSLVGTAAPDMIELDINETIREILILIHGELHEHNVLLETELSDRLDPVTGDRVQLQQVILNLVMNAIEAMRTGTDARPMVRVRSQGNGPGTVLVAVEDSGPGLSPETMERLFDTFFTTKPDGMGMGLSICRSIVDAHGGHLWASPGAPRGAIFQFTVPTARTVTEPEHAR